MKKLIALAVVLLPLVCSNLMAAPFKTFVTARGDELIDGDKPLRFISFNIPNLLIVEDNVPFAELNPWRLPDRFELTDALATVRQMGGSVVRSYVITVRRTNDTPDMPRHVLGPGKFNEEAFRCVDLALQVANEQGIRLIIPLVDNWSWQGGRAEYAGFRGKTKDEFWTDPEVIADFKQTIHFILTRTNTLTGVRYCDDKAVLCWETGNELQSPPDWTREIVRYIKSIDSNHLVMDGFHTSELRPESLAMPEVDIVTTHHYPGPNKSFDQLIRENRVKAKGKKPYVVGEFGFVSTDRMRETMKAINESGATGGLLWSLRFRDRDGGFYWHSEPHGANQYKAFHWPGSPIGDPYDEQALMTLVRNEAFAIAGEKTPQVPTPDAPKLLPITNAGAISWQGSVGATAYIVERAPDRAGPWTVLADNIDESFVQYRPLFSDETAPAGEWYYRLRARNATGTSQPSNIEGPIKISSVVFVDELSDFKRVHTKLGHLQIKTRDSRQAKEDAHRAAATTGEALVYEMPTAILELRVYAYFPDELTPVNFAVSTNGHEFTPVKVDQESYFQGAGDYHYWKPVLFRATDLPAKSRFVKLGFTGETQIGRIEITRLPDNP